MDLKFLAMIQGGEGEDVWDREKEIAAVDFRDASSQATARAEELGGQVVELQQSDDFGNIASKLEALEALKLALDIIEADGRPHGSDAQQNACECPACEFWDKIIKLVRKCDADMKGTQ